MSTMKGTFHNRAHLQQTSVVGSRPRRDNLETGNASVPRSVVLRMLRRDTGGGTVRPTEHDRTRHVSTGHVVRLSGTVDDVVDSLHGKVPGHEFTDRTQTGEGGTDGETGETHFGDGSVDDSAFSKLVEQTLGDLIGDGYQKKHSRQIFSFAKLRVLLTL